ncbi:MAG: preprotein translocase subunit SecG [Phycisphaerae bacterium]|nr:preprotein translocase subunit SecG [Phycisphaerae bacterium]
MYIWLLTGVFFLISTALVLIILVQRPQGGGLATAFGGAGGGNDSAFGGRTGDALTVATVAAFFVYLCVAIGLNMYNTAAARPEVEQPTAASGTSEVPATDPAIVIPTEVTPPAVTAPVPPTPEPAPVPTTDPGTEPAPEPAPADPQSN